MNGSEKQISWAKTIQQSMVDALSEMAEKEGASQQRAIERGKTGDEQGARIQDIDAMRAAVESNESAEWFINNRAVLNGGARWDVVVKTVSGSESKWVSFVQNKK